MSRNHPWALVGLVFLFAVASAHAQDSEISDATTGNERASTAPAAQEDTSVVPRLVKFSGVLKDLTGQPLTGPVGVTFSLYQQEADATALWWETQTVEADAEGRYTVLLGAMHPEGLPVEVFTSGEARWLGVQVGDAWEVPRILLVSAPYAFKAAEAEKLGGKRASDFVLQEQLEKEVRTAIGVQVLGQGEGSARPEAAMTAPGSKGQATTAAESDFTCSGSTPCVKVIQRGSGFGIESVAQSNSALYGRLRPPTGRSFAVRGDNASSSGTGVFGFASSDTGKTFGVQGRSNSTRGMAVHGHASAGTGMTYGVWGRSDSSSGTGVQGLAAATSGVTYAVRGDSSSPSGRGVFGFASASTGVAYGVQGLTASSSGTGVYGSALDTSGTSVGVRGRVNSPAGIAGVFNNAAGGKILSGQASGLEMFRVGGSGNVFAQGHVVGLGTLKGTRLVSTVATGTPPLQVTSITLVPGLNADLLDGVHASAFATLGPNIFVGNQSVSGAFEAATSAVGATAVLGEAADTTTLNEGVHGIAHGVDGTGLVGEAHNGSLAFGVWGFSLSGLAGQFSGNVNVTGTLTATSKNFAIDHPLDPASKLLYHASVESSEMKTIYDGTVTLDANGEAVVELPEWLEALNGDFRYQLTCVGGHAPVFVAEEIDGNRFRIAGGIAGLKVSWQVTGIRQDAYAKAHPLRVEVEKSPKAQGFYRHPALFGTPKEKGMDWAHRPETMRQMRKRWRAFVPTTEP